MANDPRRVWEQQRQHLLERRTRWETRINTWWEAQHPITQSLLRHLRAAGDNFIRNGARSAASLAYYAIFSIFPLVLLVTILFSSLLGPVVAQQQVNLLLEPFLPPSSSQLFDLFRVNITQAMEQRTSFGVIALVSLIWSGLGLFTAITISLDSIFAAPAVRSVWRQRLTAFFMGLVLLVLLSLSFLTSAVLRLVSAALLERPSLWINIGTLFLPLGLDMVIFALLFRYIPARRVYWDAVWPAAILGALGWELAKSAFSWYLNNVANYQFVYGSIATVIVLLFWAYIIAIIFLFCAEICAQINLWVIETHWTEREAAAFENRALQVIFSPNETELLPGSTAETRVQDPGAPTRG